jgi:hypothetical protein
MDNIDIYLDGKLLYGNDFDDTQIAEWYADEEEGYANLGAKDAAAYKYAYHDLNIRHVYSTYIGRLFQTSWDSAVPMGTSFSGLSLESERLHCRPIRFVRKGDRTRSSGKIRKTIVERKAPFGR